MWQGDSVHDVFCFHVAVAALTCSVTLDADEATDAGHPGWSHATQGGN